MLHQSRVSWCLVLACVVWHGAEANNLTVSKANDTAKEIHVMAILPFGGTSWPAGAALQVAMEMALENIHGRSDILPGYKIVFHYEDGQCAAGPSIRGAYHGLYTLPEKVFMIGPSCSVGCIPIAESAFTWNIPQLSYSCLAPVLSEKSRFPRFSRIIQPDNAAHQARISFMLQYNWRRVAVVLEASETYRTIVDKLVEEMEIENMFVLSYETFQTDPTISVDNLKRLDARIIVMYGYEAAGIRYLCKAYHHRMYGPKYMHILQNWYAHTWWLKVPDDAGCTSDQLYEMLGSIIYMGLATTNPLNERAIGGYTANEFMVAYEARLGNDTYGMSYGPPVYDTVFATALALHGAMEKMEAQGFNKTLDQFTYSDYNISSLAQESLLEVNFTALQGPIAFDSTGDTAASVTVHQDIKGIFTTIGLYLPKPAHVTELTIKWLNGGIVWFYGKPPKDSSKTLVEKRYVSKSLYAALCAIAGLGSIGAIGFLIFNLTFRKKKFIKMSSPNINNIILIGCLTCYSTVFIQAYTETAPLGCCVARIVTLVCGFSAAFGALFSKTWRIHVVLTSSTKKMKKVVIKDAQLAGFVFILLLINIIVIIAWQTVDPLTVAWVNATLEVAPYDGDVYIQPQYAVCSSQYQAYFTGVLYCIQGLMLIFGAFLAWETRKVKVEALNDSKFIAICIYNVAVFSVIGVAINLVLTGQINAAYAFSSGFLIAGTTLTECIVFIPKVVAVVTGNDKIGVIADMTSTTGTTNG